MVKFWNLGIYHVLPISVMKANIDFHSGFDKYIVLNVGATMLAWKHMTLKKDIKEWDSKYGQR